MKAVVCTKYGSPEVLQLRDVPMPSPRDDEVLVRIHASAVTVSDCYVRGFRVSPAFWIPMALAVGFPRPRRPILGMVLAGEVEAVGDAVSGFRPGDRVFGQTMMRFGTYAEYTCVPQGSALAPMPSRATYEEAAAIPYGGLLALHFLQARLRKGRRVLVYGASGAVGTTAVQLARHFGAEVTGVCGPTNLDLVRSLGAHAVVDYTRDDFTGQSERYDLIFDAVGRASKSRCMRTLTPGGAFVSVNGRGNLKPPARDLTFLRELFEAGQLKAVIDRCYPLERIVEAHRYVEQGHKKGNVVLTIGR
jgi:NADPH:quinone reductase-like Zn-dependent oxidoreductase